MLRTTLAPIPSGLTLAAAANSLNSQNVAPEKNVPYEVGTKWNVLDERLLLSAALFRTERKNARTEDPANPNDFITLNARRACRSSSSGSTRLRRCA